ncbi:AzlC family ABC transporter permease [Diaphorobacter sp. HDW4A]|uniref:AzlC family ABC transporter permease n=1 Tax=Diaphorobacter sp. HDW4A TaxID=2714924 RepID=UPI001F0F730E|nr:AzlC family ABC transporter permease [Diaphorobacter sp. HDW4A]
MMKEPFFKLGVTDMMGTGIGIAAWGLVTGVAMVKSGLSVPLSIFMSLLIYAGSAQLAVLPLLVAGAPLWVIWLTAICVNLRFVIFSQMWRSYFHELPRKKRLLLAYFSGDVIFVGFMKRFPDPKPGPGQIAYFSGAASTNWMMWQIPSIAGMLLANAIPLSWGLGFAGVLALLGILLSMINDRFTVLATAVAGTAAVAAFALPLKMNILVAVVAAVAAGLMFESADRHMKRLKIRQTAEARLDEERKDADASSAPDEKSEERRP